MSNRGAKAKYLYPFRGESRTSRQIAEILGANTRTIDVTLCDARRDGNTAETLARLEGTEYRKGRRRYSFEGVMCTMAQLVVLTGLTELAVQVCMDTAKQTGHTLADTAAMAQGMELDGWQNNKEGER